MKNVSIKKLIGISAIALVAGIGATDATAQSRQRERVRQQKQEVREERQELRQERQELRDQRQQARRWRVRRNGRNINVDQRQAELLRQAVNEGYRQGFEAGRDDRSRRRRSSYNTNSIYRSGTFGYQSYVDRNLYQYYFQQGFQRGYQDGYNSQSRYGYRSGNTMNILGTILGSILNIREF